MARPEAVIFDIGRVLIGWDPEGFYDRLMPRAERERMFAETGIEEMNLAIDRGAPFRDTVFALAERHPEWSGMIVKRHDNWAEMARPVIPHSVRLLRALRAGGVPVFALTNFGAETFEIARTPYPFFGEFDRAYVSAHLGVLKPEPRIYEIVEQDCGIAPDRLLFTDDKEDNIAAARARGWQAHHFDGPAGFAARLVAEGLLNERETA